MHAPTLFFFLLCVPSVWTSMIDPDTSSSVYNTTSGAYTSEGYNLVFSDEFNTADRKFGDGNDERWTAINSYNFNTGDFEAYVPDAITTKDGKLVITADVKKIALDPSGSPRAFSSGMMQSWNKTCFTGGILEMSFNLPGKVDTNSQLWAAAWMSGMLGRPAYGPLQGVLSNGNIWPYSYDTCDDNADDQKYSACTASVPAYCTEANLTSAQCDIVAANKAMLGSHGRGMTEIDVFELFTSVDYQDVGSSTTDAVLSTSYQVAPNTDSEAWSNWNTYSTCFKTVYNGCTTSQFDSTSSTYCKLYTGQYYQCAYPYSVGNSYHGESGRDSISALTPLTESDFSEDIVMRLEWEPGKWLRWLIKRDSDSDFALMLQMNQEALAACGSTAQRNIPEEPQYMLFNIALSDQAGWVNTSTTDLWDAGSYEMKVDYVRYYQRPSATSTECSTTEYPSAEFVAENPTVFALPEVSNTTQSCTYSTCGNATTSANWTEGVYSFHDTRCPSFGSIYTTGCTQPYENMCRACFTKTAFEKAAFTAEGVFGDNQYNGGNKESVAPASKPICPPCVCTKWGLDASECAAQTLTGDSSCTTLSIPHPTGAVLEVDYCSNGNVSSSEVQGVGVAPPSSIEDAVRHASSKPAPEELRKYARRPRRQQ